MSVTNQLESDTDLLVSAPVASFDLAVSMLSKHLGVSCRDAEAKLRSGRLTMPMGDSGRRLLSMLRAMGVTLAAVKTGLSAVCIRAPRGSDFAIETVALLLRRDQDRVAVELNKPWGLILSDVPESEVDRLKVALRQYPGITMTVTANADAIVDIFATAAIPTRRARAISDHINLRGLKPCRTSGALISGLNLTSAVQITNRFDDCGLLALPRAFQRFDLYLTGIGDLTPSEVMDFLMMRGDQSGRMAESVTALAPLQVETDLSRAAAIAFCADYAAIGLEVSLRLMDGNS